MTKYKAKLKKQTKHATCLFEMSENKTECIMCGENFDEDWIQCFTCKDWAHENCVEIDSMSDYYNCDVCVVKKKFVK